MPTRHPTARRADSRRSPSEYSSRATRSKTPMRRVATRIGQVPFGCRIRPCSMRNSATVSSVTSNTKAVLPNEDSRAVHPSAGISALRSSILCNSGVPANAFPKTGRVESCEIKMSCNPSSRSDGRQPRCKASARRQTDVSRRRAARPRNRRLVRFTNLGSDSNSGRIPSSRLVSGRWRSMVSKSLGSTLSSALVSTSTSLGAPTKCRGRRRRCGGRAAVGPARSTTAPWTGPARSSTAGAAPSEAGPASQGSPAASGETASNAPKVRESKKGQVWTSNLTAAVADSSEALFAASPLLILLPARIVTQSTSTS
mmetsp:Transcript_44402/g.141266  ORF Transcript_44402/g.141266 Transcript_44402/m.141266 type:complete len:313 (+) Transcript_44402:3203-4141(+)